MGLLSNLPPVQEQSVGKNSVIFSIVDIIVTDNIEIERERKDKTKYKKLVSVIKIVVETFPENEIKYMRMSNDGLTYQHFKNFIEVNNLNNDNIKKVVISSDYKEFEGRTFEIYAVPK